MRTAEALRDEVSQFKKRFAGIGEDGAFVVWFLLAYLTSNENVARDALTGGKGDKNIDALLVDEHAKQVHLMQGKYRHGLGEKGEKANEVLSFVRLAEVFAMPPAQSRTFCSSLEPRLQEALEGAIHRVRKNGYKLQLYFVTTGRVSKGIKEEAQEIGKRSNVDCEVAVLDHQHVARLFRDYDEGIAPAVPTLYLPIAAESALKVDGIHHRYDPHTEIECFVYSMRGSDVADMYERAGLRLFARNIRGYLGPSKEINDAMRKTILREPTNFWYYNNGVTIVCDYAKREVQGGRDVLRVERAQVINGQQTTRTLAAASSSRAGVLARVIRIPRRGGDEQRYDNMVSSIVRATNWQNYITPSDLVSNDHIQVHLEREMRKRGYQYLRKRQTKSEAKKFNTPGHLQIGKAELAQAVAACQLDPSTIRLGKEVLFDERYYPALFKAERVGFYLARFWLMRHVRTVSKNIGTRESSYSKWLVLHQAFSLLEPIITSTEGEKRFRFASVHKEDVVLNPLRQGLAAMFRAAGAYYRRNRGSGQEQKDLPTFFKASGNGNGFAKFWQSSHNKKSRVVSNHFGRFDQKLTEIEIDT
jgi:hypothetical protein